MFDMSRQTTYISTNRDQLREDLLELLEYGKQLHMRGWDDAKAMAWRDRVNLLLKKSFTDDSVKNKFAVRRMSPDQAQLDRRRGTNVEASRCHTQNLDHLKMIIDNLDMYDDKQPNLGRSVNVGSSDVFVVHGRDEASKHELARLLESLDLRVVILHERPMKGRTLVEKLEEESNVGFAVILLTADDVGAAKDDKDENGYQFLPRARQNVIAELGYFIGRLTRKRVCVLYEDLVELPSDFDGVGYIPLDSGGGWKTKLVQELREAGFEVDANHIR